MKSKISLGKIRPSIVKGIFKKEQALSNKCDICGLEFTDPERTKNTW